MRKWLAACGIFVGIASARADGLDRASIASGITQVKAKVAACGEQIKVGGTIKVTVTVGADGKVTSAKRVSGDETLGACVVDVIKTATFKPSASGGSFSYPFVFSAPPPSEPPRLAIPSPAPPPDINDLDRESITAGVGAVMPRIKACGQKVKVTGTIRVSVTIGTNGKVTSAKRTAGDEKLGACVVDVMKTATFKPNNGGSFSYPFVFGAPEGPASTTGTPPPPPATDPPRPPSTENINIDRAAIEAGIGLIKAKIAACGDKIKATTTIKITVTVGPDGKVTKATRTAGDEKLGACVVDVMKTAAFKATKSGGSFSYPFVFEGPSSSGPPAPPAPVATGDSALDRAMIQTAIEAVKSKVQACGKTNKAQGLVKVRVVVAASGKPTTVEVESTPDAALGACVAAAIRQATFAKTGQGGSFSYPFVF